MSQLAKLFINGRSQAVRLPAAFRFNVKEVYIRQDAETGDVILSRRPDNWDDFFKALNATDVPVDFLSKAERNQEANSEISLDVSNRDPFEGWRE